jgi:orotidine-5'-phosphate decarboxylase
VHQFALDAKTAGMTGLVCSAEELQMLKLYPDLAGLHPVVPAIRPAGSAKDDQKRVGTPAQAIKDGARVLVVGRPIIEASDPVEATKRILDEIAEGMRLKEVA